MRFELTKQPMNRAVERLTLLFVGAFAVCCVAVAVYQLLWVAPAKRCEERGWWWDADKRICGMPIFLPNITPPAYRRASGDAGHSPRPGGAERLGFRPPEHVAGLAVGVARRGEQQVRQPVQISQGGRVDRLACVVQPDERTLGPSRHGPRQMQGRGGRARRPAG